MDTVNDEVIVSVFLSNDVGFLRVDDRWCIKKEKVKVNQQLRHNTCPVF